MPTLGNRLATVGGNDDGTEDTQPVGRNLGPAWRTDGWLGRAEHAEHGLLHVGGYYSVVRLYS